MSKKRWNFSNGGTGKPTEGSPESPKDTDDVSRPELQEEFALTEGDVVPGDSSPASPLSSPAVAEQPAEPVANTPEPALQAKAEAKSTSPRFRVLRRRPISMNGSLTHVEENQIVDDVLYGRDGVKKLIQQGVELEEIA